MQPILTIDLAAIAANYRFYRQMRPQAEIAAVVKCDAYGLGVDRVAPALAAAGCRVFFTATWEEGARLRAILTGPTQSPPPTIYVLNGPADGEAEAFCRHALAPVLNSAEQIAYWRAAGQGRPAALHIDTGMNRLGLRLDEAAALAAGGAIDGVEIALVISHLACADEAGHPMNAAQAAAFARAAGLFPGARRSLGASAGGLEPGLCRDDLVRAGIGLYGAGPFGAPDSRFRAAATAEAEILQIRQVPAGETIGYGAAHRVGRDSRIAILNIGYGDGFLRAGGGRVWIAGGQAPVIGRISMDLTAIDVTDLRSPGGAEMAAAGPGALLRPGDRAELFGPHMPIEQVAAAAETISYEILTSLGSRYRRIYRD